MFGAIQDLLVRLRGDSTELTGAVKKSKKEIQREIRKVEKIIK